MRFVDTNVLLYAVSLPESEHDVDIIMHAMRARPQYTRLWQATR